MDSQDFGGLYFSEVRGFAFVYDCWAREFRVGPRREEDAGGPTSWWLGAGEAKEALLCLPKLSWPVIQVESGGTGLV